MRERRFPNGPAAGLLIGLLTAVLSSAALKAQGLPDAVCRSVVQALDTGDLGYSELRKACREIGHRLTGSENGALAEARVLNWLKAQGLEQVRFDSFPVRTWFRGPCRLEIVPYRSDNYVRMGAVALSHTSSCDSIFPIADGGDGLEADLASMGNQIPGKCLMLNLGLSRNDGTRRNLHRAEKVSLAMRYGASAVLFVHPGPDGTILTGTASLTGETLPVPALCISAEDGRTIREWSAKEKLMADFRVKNEERNTWARNVVATIPAARPTRETILFTAHLDSWDLATGAVDNGTGSFTLLDVARQVYRHRHLLRRNVCFLWTMGEEQGLLGSRHFCEEQRKNGSLPDIRMVINLDMVASPEGFNHYDWPGMAGLTREAASAIAPYVPSFLKKEAGQPHLHSDHQPFMLEGVPVVTVVSSIKDSVLACYHADCDDFGLVNQEDMRYSAQVHSLLALFMGSRGELPVKHLRRRQIPKWLETHGLKEKLQISREWRWK